MMVVELAPSVPGGALRSHGFQTDAASQWFISQCPLGSALEPGTQFPFLLCGRELRGTQATSLPGQLAPFWSSLKAEGRHVDAHAASP